VQTVVITVLSLVFGLFVRIDDLLVAYLILGLITLMSSALGYGFALMVHNDGVLAQIINNIGQPLLLLSGCLLPIALAPTWLQRVADWNPFGWAVEGIRALYAGRMADSAVTQSLLGISVLTVIALAWSARLFARNVN
jgi:ABC-2 type transport system permease protein